MLKRRPGRPPDLGACASLARLATLRAVALWRKAKGPPRSDSLQVNVANANLAELQELTTRLFDTVNQVEEADDYTASLYASAFAAARVHVNELCVLSPMINNRALREAIEPVLMLAKFDESAWVSMLETSALWFVTDWAERFDSPEREYICDMAGVLTPTGQMGNPDLAVQLARQFAKSVRTDAARTAQHAADSVCRSASEGAIGLTTYETGQDLYAPVQAWEKGQERLAYYMETDDFHVRNEAALVRAARSA